MAIPDDESDAEIDENRGDPLDESAERMKLALEAAGLGTFRIDVASGVVHYSPELAALLGFPGVRTVRLEDAFQRIHRDDVEMVRSLYEASLDPLGDGRLRMELRYVRPGGAVRWMTWNGRVDFREEAYGRHPYRVLGACADVTDRKEAEERVRESEARFRALVELSTDWYWEQDEHLRFSNFSSRIAWLTGSEPGGLIGRRRWDLPHIGVSPETWAEHRAVLARREPFRDFEFQRINELGETIWVSVNGDPVFDGRGRFKGYRGTGHNITARKEAEAQLKESEARFRILADSAPVLIWVTGPNGAEFFNRPYIDFVGASSEADLIGGAWERNLHPDDRAAYTADLAAAQAELAQFEAQCRLRRADGIYRWMKSIGRPRFAPDGRSLGYVGSTLDITDVKANEERISHLARELDHRVKNILSRFAAVIDRTADAPLGTDAFVAALQERVTSMARAHSLLSSVNWSAVPLDQLVRDQVEAYGTASNLDVRGDALLLSADAAQSLCMVFNELATNAAKYGALSSAGGRVFVAWSLAGDGGDETLELEWREEGGPAIVGTPSEGYGTSVIKGLLVHELAASVVFELRPDGAHCRIVLPAADVVVGR